MYGVIALTGESGDDAWALPKMMFRYLAALLLALPASALETRMRAGSATLQDDLLSATIANRDGRIVSLKWKDKELIRGDRGYWSLTGNSGRSRLIRFPEPATVRITADPAENGGKLARISVECPATGREDELPVDTTFHYCLVPGGAGLYLYAELRHPAGHPGFRLVEGRFVIKPDPAVFDYIHIDDRRSGIAPRGEDWDAASPSNLKEARHLETGLHAGHVEHKYGYSALFSESPAYGWCSTKDKLGLWMVHPSLESIAGGPTKPELTAHLDVNPGGRPVLLNMWHGSHYGGTVLEVDENETWSKVIGPFLLHVNEGAEPGALAAAALETARRESAAWPYDWLDSNLYAADSRREVRGRIRPPVSSDAGSAPLWVGLTAPDYETRDRRRATAVDWQRDGKHYQYWTRAAADGSFRLPSVRDGSYTLHAFQAGVLGEFSRADVAVSSDADLGEMEWVPEREGPTVWEIGIPDRSAAEFFHGDRYWKWGSYYDYQSLFPDDVDFHVGTSNWKKDWFFCQPPRLDEDGRVKGPSTWTVRFDLDEKPADHLLRISLCGYRGGGNLRVSLNGAPIGETGVLPENGVMHRDGIRGIQRTWSFPLPADRLRSGENLITLRSHATEWHHGILYDYLRLERPEAPVAATNR